MFWGRAASGLRRPSLLSSDNLRTITASTSAVHVSQVWLNSERHTLFLNASKVNLTEVEALMKKVNFHVRLSSSSTNTKLLESSTVWFEFK